jgi:hypothetical protein
MDELTRVACAMGYTDLRRRLIKAYRAHSADQDPNAEGDPRLEQKLAAKLGSYGPVGFLLLLRELSEDLPELHVQARRDLAEYAIHLRNYWAPTTELPNLAADKGDELLPTNTGNILHLEGHPTPA